MVLSKEQINFYNDQGYLLVEEKTVEPTYVATQTEKLLFDMGRPSATLSFDSMRPCLELPNEFIAAIPNWVKNVTCKTIEPLSSSSSETTTITSNERRDESVFSWNRNVVQQQGISTLTSFPCSMKITGNIFPPPLQILVSGQQGKEKSLSQKVFSIEWEDLLLMSASSPNDDEYPPLISNFVTNCTFPTAQEMVARCVQMAP